MKKAENFPTIQMHTKWKWSQDTAYFCDWATNCRVITSHCERERHDVNLFMDATRSLLPAPILLSADFHVNIKNSLTYQTRCALWFDDEGSWIMKQHLDRSIVLNYSSSKSFFACLFTPNICVWKWKSFAFWKDGNRKANWKSRSAAQEFPKILFFHRSHHPDFCVFSCTMPLVHWQEHCITLTLQRMHFRNRPINAHAVGIWKSLKPSCNMHKVPLRRLQTRSLRRCVQFSLFNCLQLNHSCAEARRGG